MEHTLYHSIDYMTQSEIFSDLVGQSIKKTCLVPFEPSGWSSTESSFLSVDDCKEAIPRYVFKRMRRDHDWVMQATEDDNWRAISIWQHGLLDHLPEGIDHGIIGCTADKEGYAILMHNVSHTLLRDDISVSAEDHKFILESMATFHAVFWENSELLETKYNLCKPEGFFSHTSPVKARQMKETNSSIVLEFIIEGRLQLQNFIDSSLVKVLNNLVVAPTLFCKKLTNYPYTLVHSDIRRANLGISREAQQSLIMLDWARPTATVPAVDLIYYLFSISLAHMPISIEASIELYKHHLAKRLGNRFAETWWKPQLELSILGVFATMGCFKAYFAANSESEDNRKQDQANLEYWADRAIKGVEILER